MRVSTEAAVNFAVGVEVRHPPSYQRMIWEVVTDSTKRYLLLYKRRLIETRVQIESSRFIERTSLPQPDSGHVRCMLTTRSGVFPAAIYRGQLGRCTGCPPPEPSYDVVVRLAHPRTGTVLMFHGFARDSADGAEQLAMAGTIRLLQSPRDP